MADYYFMATEPLSGASEMVFKPYSSNAHYFDSPAGKKFTIQRIVFVPVTNSANRAYPDNRRFPLDWFLPANFPAGASNAGAVTGLEDYPDPPLLHVSYLPLFTGYEMLRDLEVPMDGTREAYVYADGGAALRDYMSAPATVPERVGINPMRSGFSDEMYYFTGVDAYGDTYHGMFKIPL